MMAVTRVTVTESNNTKPLIFISYSHKDRRVATDLVKSFRHQGWSVAWDSDFRAGDRWRQRIEQNITDAHCVVALWSRDSVASRWVLEEAELATRSDKLVPVLLDTVELPFGHSEIHAANLVGWKGEASHEGILKLLESVRQRIRWGAPIKPLPKPPWWRPVVFPIGAALPAAMVTLFIHRSDLTTAITVRAWLSQVTVNTVDERPFTTPKRLARLRAGQLGDVSVPTPNEDDLQFRRTALFEPVTSGDSPGTIALGPISLPESSSVRLQAMKSGQLRMDLYDVPLVTVTLRGVVAITGHPTLADTIEFASSTPVRLPRGPGSYLSLRVTPVDDAAFDFQQGILPSEVDFLAAQPVQDDQFRVRWLASSAIDSAKITFNELRTSADPLHKGDLLELTLSDSGRISSLAYDQGVIALTLNGSVRDIAVNGLDTMPDRLAILIARYAWLLALLLAAYAIAVALLWKHFPTPLFSRRGKS